MAENNINTVCYATLGLDQPWSLENYYKVGGWRCPTSGATT